MVFNPRKFLLVNGGRSKIETRLGAITIQTPKTRIEKKIKKENFSITISLVLILIASNIKTNDFHFISDVSQETEHQGGAQGWWRMGRRIAFSRLENVIFITLIKFKLSLKRRTFSTLLTISSSERGNGWKIFAEENSLVFLLIIIKNYQKQAIKSRLKTMIAAISLSSRKQFYLLLYKRAKCVSDRNSKP